MSRFPITHFRLFNEPFDHVFDDQLQLLDPWRDFHALPTTLSNRFRWINQPNNVTHSSTTSSLCSTSNTTSAGETSATVPAVSTISEKFRVQLDVAGFNPETIKTKVEGRKVIIEAKQEDHLPDGAYTVHEVRKTYELPEHADVLNLTSFITPTNTLVVEVPVNNPCRERLTTATEMGANALVEFGQYRDPFFDYNHFIMSPDFHPRIIDTHNNGQKQLKMNVALKNYQPEQIKVSIKNNELIVQAEHVYNDTNRSERSFLTKSITLPPGTQIERLQSFLNADGQLEIEAPFIEPNQIQSILIQ